MRLISSASFFDANWMGGIPKKPQPISNLTLSILLYVYTDNNMWKKDELKSGFMHADIQSFLDVYPDAYDVINNYVSADKTFEKEENSKLKSGLIAFFKLANEGKIQTQACAGFAGVIIDTHCEVEYEAVQSLLCNEMFQYLLLTGVHCIDGKPSSIGFRSTMFIHPLVDSTPPSFDKTPIYKNNYEPVIQTTFELAPPSKFRYPMFANGLTLYFNFLVEHIWRIQHDIQPRLVYKKFEAKEHGFQTPCFILISQKGDLHSRLIRVVSEFLSGEQDVPNWVTRNSLCAESTTLIESKNVNLCQTLRGEDAMYLLPLVKNATTVDLSDNLLTKHHHLFVEKVLDNPHLTFLDLSFNMFWAHSSQNLFNILRNALTNNKKLTVDMRANIIIRKYWDENGFSEFLGTRLLV